VSIRLPDAQAARLPVECACCGETASHSAALGRKDGVMLQVGYCDECAEHQAESSARTLSVGLSSLLLGLVLAAGVPLVAPRLGFFGLLAVTLTGATLPLLALLLGRAAPSAPHVARGPAVLWTAEGKLWCAAPAYAERVAALNDGEPKEASLRERVGSAWLSAGPVLGIGAACLSFYVYHPLLRVINLGSVRAEVALDGQWLASVEPTGNESPVAGALLRVPAGLHTLTATSSLDGAVIDRAEAHFHSGAVHLFAIAGDETCFWLETAGYGRERRAEPSYEPLSPVEHFLVLPGGIDTWFAPNPEADGTSARSSGGLLTALRQAPCAGLPQEVRALR